MAASLSPCHPIVPAIPGGHPAPVESEGLPSGLSTPSRERGPRNPSVDLPSRRAVDGDNRQAPPSRDGIQQRKRFIEHPIRRTTQTLLLSGQSFTESRLVGRVQRAARLVLAVGKPDVRAPLGKRGDPAACHADGVAAVVVARYLHAHTATDVACDAQRGRLDHPQLDPRRRLGDRLRDPAAQAPGRRGCPHGVRFRHGQHRDHVHGHRHRPGASERALDDSATRSLSW